MGKSGSSPNPPDPKELIPLQTAGNKEFFNYQTDANRYNIYGPTGSQTWDKQEMFDQAGFDKAMAEWSKGNQQGTWVPGTAAGAMTGVGADAVWDPNAGGGSGGYWDGGTQNQNAAPTRDQFVTYKYGLTNQLSPEQQAIFDLDQGTQTNQSQLLQALMQRLQGQWGESFDPFAGAPGLETGQGLDPQQFSQEASDAAYSAATRYLDPQTKQVQSDLEARLSEQGFVPGTPGYARAMETLQDTNARAYGAARDSATTQGFQVGSQQFRDMLSKLGFTNTARTQSIAEALQSRMQPFNEFSMLSGMRPGSAADTLTGAPQGGAGNLQGVDQLGAYQNQYQGLLDQYNADVQGDNNTTSTLASLAGIAAMVF